MLWATGVQHEHPAEKVRDEWKKISFPQTMRYQQDVDDVIERIMKARRLMYTAGEFQLNDPESERKELEDVRKMIPLGGELRRWTEGRDWKSNNILQWFWVGQGVFEDS